MNETKTMKRSDFVICTALAALLSYFIYFKLIFRSCGVMTYDSSIKLFGVIAAASFVIFGIMQHIEDYRGFMIIYIMVFSPISIYTFISYQTVFALCFKGVILGTLILTAKIFHWYYTNENASDNRENDTLFCKLIMFALIMHCIFVFLMTIATVCIGINNCFGGAYRYIHMTPEYKVDSQCLFVEYREEFEKFADGSWDEMNTEERLGLAQTLADYEAEKLGLKNTLRVTAKKINSKESDFYILGKYTEHNSTITVELEYLETCSAFDMIGTIAHETYHSYEKALLDLYHGASEDEKKLMVFDDVRYYDSEFFNYIDGDNDYDGYYDQKMEENARDYSLKEQYYFMNMLTQGNIWKTAETT